MRRLRQKRMKDYFSKYVRLVSESWTTIDIVEDDVAETGQRTETAIASLGITGMSTDQGHNVMRNQVLMRPLEESWKVNFKQEAGFGLGKACGPLNGKVVCER